jgi:sugar transferase (PEP-CTERM/EpsH1 system associated)
LRILFLTSEFPYPPYAGAPMRNFGLMEGLAEHEIWLLSFKGQHGINPAETPLNDICQTIHVIESPQRNITDRLRDLLLSTKADIAGRFYSEAFARQLTTWLKEQSFDVIQIENLEMTVYLPLIKQLQPETPVIYDAHNAEYALQQRIYETDRSDVARLPGAAYSLIQARRVREMETQVCSQVDYIIAVSNTDAELLERLNCGQPVAIVPNGISTQLYQAPATPAVELEDIALVFTGKMDYRPNVDAVLWFAQEVLPQIRQELPNAHFYVVGQSPHPRLDVLRGQAGITLTGLVPAIQPYLQAASVFVVPLRMGSGTRLKVLEAMATGCPIVSTHIGSQGINITAGQELVQANTAKEFAQAVINLHKNPEKAAELGRNARAFVQANYDWRVLLPQLKKVYEELGVI